jgi:hypothetical protein
MVRFVRGEPDNLFTLIVKLQDCPVCLVAYGDRLKGR